MAKIKENSIVRDFEFYQDKKNSVQLSEKGDNQVLGSIYLSRSALINPSF